MQVETLEEIAKGILEECQESTESGRQVRFFVVFVVCIFFVFFFRTFGFSCFFFFFGGGLLFFLGGFFGVLCMLVYACVVCW